MYQKFFNRGKRKRRDSRHCLFTATFVVLEMTISRKNLPKLWVCQELEMINRKKLTRHNSRYRYFHCYICGLTKNNNWGVIISINHKTTMLWKSLQIFIGRWVVIKYSHSHLSSHHSSHLKMPTKIEINKMLTPSNFDFYKKLTPGLGIF